MRRVVVDSTSIASVGYEPGRRELEIESRQSGDVYLYFEVPAEEHEELEKAEVHKLLSRSLHGGAVYVKMLCQCVE